MTEYDPDTDTIVYGSLPPLIVGGDLTDLPLDVSKHLGPGNHPNGTPQAVHGRGGTLGHLADQTTVPDGGFTYSKRFGMPEGGKALSIYPEREVELGPDTSREDRIAALDQFTQDNADLLAQPNHYVGGWNNPETGTVHLDVSVNVPDADTAIDLAQSTEQIAYFDLDTFRSVTVGIRHPDGRYEPIPRDTIEKGAPRPFGPGEQAPGRAPGDPGGLPGRDHGRGHPQPWPGSWGDLIPLFKHLGPGAHPSGTPQAVHAGGGAISPTGTDGPAYADLPEKYRKAMASKAAKLGITDEMLDAQLQDHLDRGNRDHADWYDTIHRRSNDLAATYNVSPTAAAGTIAALSPMREFGKNMRDAETLLRVLDEDRPFTPTQEDLDAFNKGRDPKRPIAKPGTYIPSELDTTLVASLHPEISSLANFTGMRDVVKATAIARGADPDAILGGPKVRSFYSNIADPSAPAVTIDTWMYRAMIPSDHVFPEAAGKVGGHTLSQVGDIDLDAQKVFQGSPGALKGTGVSSNVGLYPMFAESVQRVAAANNLRPHSVQAIVWEVARTDAGYRATNLEDYT